MSAEPEYPVIENLLVWDLRSAAQYAHDVLECGYRPGSPVYAEAQRQLAEALAKLPEWPS